MSSTAIALDGLTKYYGAVVGLDELSLRVDLLRPTSGRAAVLGFDCQRQAMDARRQIGYLPGEMPMYPELSGAAYLRFLASLAPAAGSAWDGSEGWTISLRDANGDAVEGAALAVEAWRPEGMDAAPQIASAKPLGTGRYHVDGVALRSSGWWNMKLAIRGAAADSLAFNLVLR